MHLTSHGGIKPVYDEKIAAFVPGGFAPTHFGAGAVMGRFGPQAAIKDGNEMRRKGRCRFRQDAKPVAPPEGKDRAYHILPVWLPAVAGKGKAFVDVQIRRDREGHQDRPSGRLCQRRASEALHHAGHGHRPGQDLQHQCDCHHGGPRAICRSPQAGTTTFRPPYTGLAVGAIAGRTIGHHFRPYRLSPLHDANKANGATFIEAGLWMRAWYYAWAGNSPETAYIKEMELVRKGVGLADVSTLGKIDVQGPDAAEFLNRVYVNGFAKLPVGKARYGVMLNDDGVVLDDGTTTRISDTQFYLTTTTAQAGEVMSWLEYLLQVHWTDLKVHVTSLTDEWAGMAVSGPKSREALQLAFPDADVSNENLPYMGCLEVHLDGVPIRLLRLSFSGELAYEVHCPADYAHALWEHFLKVAEPLGIKPYGLEALASLRIEKGHVAGLELDHRNTLDDLGLGKMAGKEKAYVGKELRLRENLQAPERWSLVGIELMEAGQETARRLHPVFSRR